MSWSSGLSVSLVQPQIEDVLDIILFVSHVLWIVIECLTVYLHQTVGSLTKLVRCFGQFPAHRAIANIIRVALTQLFLLSTILLNVVEVIALPMFDFMFS